MTSPTPDPKRQQKAPSGDAPHKDATASAAASVEQQNQDPNAADGVDVTVIGVEDDLSAVEYDESDGNTMVQIKQAIVEEFYFPNTERPSFRTLFHAGQMVPKAVVDQYNADMAQAKLLRENGGVDPKNPAGIDSTTIASGTRVTLDD